jgi:hypothetical protein
MSTTRILRPAQLHRTKKGEGLLGIGHSKFCEDYILHDENKPFIPGTKIRRLKPMKLGDRAVGFFEDEVLALIEGLRKHRDSTVSP